MCPQLRCFNHLDIWLLQELELLKAQLNSEKKSKKELAMANVKLNGMLKIGQDALKAEQELVQQLKGQLEEKAKVS